jgi:hypothetical protein
MSTTTHKLPQTPEDAELLALRVRKHELLSKKVEFMRRHGLSFYKPHQKQDAFHRAGGAYKRRMVRAGNRFGKSHMGAAEDIAWLRGEREWYAKDDAARYAGIPQRPVKGLIITTDWDVVRDIWSDPNTGKLWRFLQKDEIKSTSRANNGAIAMIVTKRGSMLSFDTVKSFSSNPQGSESADWDFIHVDEPCTKEQWVAQSRGLVDRGGAAWFTLTPLREPWINDYFFNDSGEQASEDVWATDGSIYDNPTLSREAIDAWVRTLDDDEKECRVNGLPLHMAGLVYKEFLQSVHVPVELPLGWVDWETPPAGWPIYVAIDPHPQTPHAVLFCAMSPFGKRYYFKDMFVRCGITELVQGCEHKNVRGILPFLKGRMPVWTKMDPLGFIEDPEEGTCLATEAGDAGLPVERATKALEQGIIRCKQELARRDDKGNPFIYVFPSCRRFLWEVRRYSWDAKDNKPVDKDDHIMEDFYRLEISNMRYIDCSIRGRVQPMEDIVINSADLDLETV